VAARSGSSGTRGTKGRISGTFPAAPAKIIRKFSSYVHGGGKERTGAVVSPRSCIRAALAAVAFSVTFSSREMPRPDGSFLFQGTRQVAFKSTLPRVSCS